MKTNEQLEETPAEEFCSVIQAQIDTYRYHARSPLDAFAEEEARQGLAEYYSVLKGVMLRISDESLMETVIAEDRLEGQIYSELLNGCEDVDLLEVSGRIVDGEWADVFEGEERLVATRLQNRFFHALHSIALVEFLSQHRVERTRATADAAA